MNIAANFSDLIGKTINSIERTNSEEGNDALNFFCSDDTKYIMTHRQDCCENVNIDDINGDLDDLLGTPILMAEEVSYEPTSEEEIKRTKESNEWGSCTWTFYKLATIKGYVNIKWYGESNGYYSESVYFEQIK